ncbi:hypothetical protein ACQP2P_26685 [Dactylosporangium sp. CA-139114]|uniref:hypothetical protein n=1 Tax=Dactylosporangium sp. CA-139114 TaxID=3239931 RepID=UPI003D960C84
MHPDAPDFETKVLAAFLQTLQRYCEQLRGTPTAARDGLSLASSIVTARPVPQLRGRIRREAERVLGRELPGARLERTFFALDPRMSEPWYAIGIDHRLPAPTADDEPEGPVLILTLAFSGPLRWAYPLVIADAWQAIRRGPPSADLRQEISLPDHVNAVPAGPLLRLRYRPGVVEVCRTDLKPHYAVAVDEYLLAPGNRVALAGHGRIRFTNGTAQSELRYVLMERQ